MLTILNATLTGRKYVSMFCLALMLLFFSFGL